MVQFLCWSVVVIKNQGFGFTRARNLVWIIAGSIRFQLAYYTLGTTTKLSMLFHVLGLWLHLNLKYTYSLGLGLNVTEINIKKYRNKEIKASKM